MSKLTIKHKDTIMIKLTYYEELLNLPEVEDALDINNNGSKIEDAKYKGWIDALKWVLSFEEISEDDYLNIMFPQIKHKNKKHNEE
tara:strand:- start:1398 stop:1655 length:258 start_codon:yes stop_codon:yes gene_type:complete